MSRRGLVGMALACLWLAACGGRGEFRCEDTSRYAPSTSVAPLRIPGDLTPPDESQALSVPPAPTANTPNPERVAGRCLETPPEYQPGAVAAPNDT